MRLLFATVHLLRYGATSVLRAYSNARLCRAANVARMRSEVPRR